ncbi:MAG: restriction endonuclease subunit S [Lewinellaceae bacterium]|nr:restriction endonuclease subunit S [Lewinellaceae bacterium]
MMEKFKKYKSYADSSLDWLGSIPSHWIIEKGKWHWKKEKRPVRPEDETVTVFRDGEVTLRKNRRIDGFTNSVLEIGYQGVRKGDLVIHGMDAFAGSIGVSDSDGKSTPVYSVCTPKKGSNPYYFAYLLKVMSKRGWIESLARGIRERSTEFKYNQFASLDYPIPPVAEQQRIVEFLDHKTAQIAHYIQLKEKTITLLEERKAAIINQAVTKGLPAEAAAKAGLNPDAPMKDSGIEWLGEIPEHWIVKKLKWNSKTTSGGTPPSGNREDFYNGDIPWIRTTDLNNNELFDVPEKVTGLALKYTACKIVPENTVCVAMYGGPGTIGKHSIIRFSGTVNQALCAIIPSPDIIPDYLYYYLKFYRPIWMINAKGSRVDPNISQDEVRNMIIPYPSSREQSSIVKYIKFNCDRIDELISKNEKEITLIKEYRESLISAAVTGKIDVREYQQTASEYATADNH